MKVIYKIFTVAVISEASIVQVRQNQKPIAFDTFLRDLEPLWALQAHIEWRSSRV